jgi:hypothetical protein
MSFTSALYMQVVELSAGPTAKISNGMRLVFDELTFGGVLAYSEGLDVNPNTTTVASKQTFGMLTDATLDDTTPATFTSAAEFASSAANLDLWLIELAGPQPLYSASHLPGPPGGVGTWTNEDPDNMAVVSGVQNDLTLAARAQVRSSGIELLTGSRPALNNDNPEFPRIVLPGNRQLFHWRNGTNALNPSYGFGILFGDTGTFRNLVPSTFATFTGTGVRSCFDWEVGVTPDGNRALVVLDEVAGSNPERLFVLNLEPGGTFFNGLPIAEVTPTTTTLVGKIYEESFTFLKDGAGGWVGFFGATSATTAGQAPQRMLRVNMTPVNAASVAAVLLPGSGFPNVVSLHRQMVASSDYTQLCCVASESVNPSARNVYRVYNVSSIAHTVANITQYSAAAPTDLAEWGDANDGETGYAAFSPTVRCSRSRASRTPRRSSRTSCARTARRPDWSRT